MLTHGDVDPSPPFPPDPWGCFKTLRTQRWMDERMERQREVKLLVGLDSSVEMQQRVGEGREEEEGVGLEEEEKRVVWGFSSSPLQHVGLPGYWTVWSWW